jgi:hypothetical protein
LLVLPIVDPEGFAGYTGGMSNLDQSDSGDRPDLLGKTRTWWHPLLARLLDHVLATAYTVCEEVLVGKQPLRVDILLIRREAGQLSEASHRDLAVLLPLLNRFTLIQFKGPTDALERGDLAQLIGCAFLWHGQQIEPIPKRDISLIVLAPTFNEALRNELRLLGDEVREHERGVFRLEGLPFATWLVESDVMAERGEPVLSLVSRVFLKHRERIIEQLTHTGHVALLYYMLQQVQQFRSLGEDFAMQHKDSEYLGEVEEELLTTVLEAIPAEKRVRGLPPEDRLRGLDPEELLRGLGPEDRLRGLGLEDRLRGLDPEELLRALGPEDRLRGLGPEDRLRGLGPEDRLRGLGPEDRLRGLGPEDRLRGLGPEDRLRGLGPEDRLRGLSPEELAAGLSEEQAARLRELLERTRGR